MPLDFRHSDQWQESTWDQQVDHKVHDCRMISEKISEVESDNEMKQTYWAGIVVARHKWEE